MNTGRLTENLFNFFSYRLTIARHRFNVTTCLRSTNVMRDYNTKTIDADNAVQDIVLVGTDKTKLF